MGWVRLGCQNFIYNGLGQTTNSQIRLTRPNPPLSLSLSLSLYIYIYIYIHTRMVLLFAIFVYCYLCWFDVPTKLFMSIWHYAQV